VSPAPRRLEVVSKQATKVTALSTRLEWKIDQVLSLRDCELSGRELKSQ
jgi:hypothetical protein